MSQFLALAQPDAFLYPDTNYHTRSCEMSHVVNRMPERIAILYGSQSGNASLVAEAIASRLTAAGLPATVLPEDGIEPAALAAIDTLFVCTSSHGHGELPDNLTPTHARLVAERPDLSHLSFGVIALGDSTYSDTYCGAGATMDRLLEELGARRLKPRLEVDVSIETFAEEPALDWIDEWVAARG